MRTLLTVFSILCVSACASAQERAQLKAQREIDACIERGVEQGTEAFDACRMQERAKAKDRLERRMDNSDSFRPQPGAGQAYRW